VQGAVERRELRGPQLVAGISRVRAAEHDDASGGRLRQAVEVAPDRRGDDAAPGEIAVRAQAQHPGRVARAREAVAEAAHGVAAARELDDLRGLLGTRASERALPLDRPEPVDLEHPRVVPAGPGGVRRARGDEAAVGGWDDAAQRVRGARPVLVLPHERAGGRELHEPALLRRLVGQARGSAQDPRAVGELGRVEQEVPADAGAREAQRPQHLSRCVRAHGPGVVLDEQVEHVAAQEQRAAVR
jgi:hypothetical protein